MKLSKQKQLSIIGWREWIALPELGVTAIKAKIDTGARSSAIHAFHVETFSRNGKHRVRFQMHPFQRSASKTITAEAEILDEREVRNSGGHAEKRIAILTTVELQQQRWPIELTLTSLLRNITLMLMQIELIILLISLRVIRRALAFLKIFSWILEYRTFM